MRTARYRAVPPKIDRRRSIEGEKGKKKKKRKRRKKKKRRRRKKYLFSPRRRCPRVARTPSSTGAFSPVRGDGTSPRAGRKIEATTEFDHLTQLLHSRIVEPNAREAAVNSENIERTNFPGQTNKQQYAVEVNVLQPASSYEIETPTVPGEANKKQQFANDVSQPMSSFNNTDKRVASEQERREVFSGLHAIVTAPAPGLAVR
ncbi:hypothetical protein GW17_00011095 [Ensete ventricosum]|nr:hypothetical protein GW17_00011095 [Ensete ventricosum]